MVSSAPSAERLPDVSYLQMQVMTVCACVGLQGRFTIAAKHHITIAEVYEAELVDIEKVCDFFLSLFFFFFIHTCLCRF